MHVHPRRLYMQVPIYKVFSGPKTELPQHIRNIASLASRTIKNRLIQMILVEEQAKRKGEIREVGGGF